MKHSSFISVCIILVFSVKSKQIGLLNKTGFGLTFFSHFSNYDKIYSHVLPALLFYVNSTFSYELRKHDMTSGVIILVNTVL